MKLCLYSDGAPENLNLKEIVGYLGELGFKASIEGDFLDKLLSDEQERGFAEKLASLRIRDLSARGALNFNPSESDILNELETLKVNKLMKLKKDPSSVYEGFGLETLFQEIYGRQEFAVVFTSRMFATWDKRYHGCTIICGYPLALVSITGLVEAPAKPKEYYAKLAAYHSAKQMGFALPSEDEFLEQLKHELKGRFLDYEDTRLTEVAKGYALQAAFFFAALEPFCSLPACRLYNAHTQEDMLAAQINGKLCSRHEGILRKFCDC